MLTRSIPVLCYHDISEHGLAPDRFISHLDAMAQAGWRTLTARELLAVTRGEMKAQKKSVVITFDDGHLSNFLIAAPELEKRSMTGIFFAVTDFIVPGSIRTPETAPASRPMPDCFRDALKVQNYEQFINENEITTLLDAGHEVYAHGGRHQGTFRCLSPRKPLGNPKSHWSAVGIYPAHADKTMPTFEAGSAYVYDGFWPHPETVLPFTRRSKDARRQFCRDDMARSLKRIRELNPEGEQLFCWPWGQFDAVSEDELKRAGFAGAFTLERGFNGPGTDPFRLNRVGVAKNKDAKWLLTRLNMYASPVVSRTLVKRFRKRPDIANVLYCTDSLKLSGGSRQMVNNALSMHDFGLRVTVAAPKKSLIPTALPEGMEFVPFEDWKQLRKAGAFISETVRDRSIDLVHTFHSRAYKPACLAKITSAFSKTRFKLFINRGVIFKPNMLFALWAAIADRLVVNSFECAKSLKRVGVRDSRMAVVYNSFIPEGPPPPERESRKKRGVRILSVTNEGKAKGGDVFMDTVVRIVAEHDPRDLDFVLPGLKKSKKLTNKYPDEIKHRVNTPGVLAHADLLEEFNHADMLVMTSRQESLPNVLIEAFHAGLPVVCTRAGGTPELVSHGKNGLLCPIEDTACLAEQIMYLAHNRDERLRMGAINRHVVVELFGNRRKGLDLLRVYHGKLVRNRLNIERLAASGEE